MSARLRLSVFATHPIQYQVPLWRQLSRDPRLAVHVHYFSDHSVRGGVDPGFDKAVAWDVPLLEGYSYEFVSRTADLGRPHTVALPDAAGQLRHADWAMILGYTRRFERQVITWARRHGVRVLMRAEFADSPDEGGILRKVLREAYLRWFYSRIDSFCFIGHEAHRHLLRRGVPPGKLFFAPYAVDTSLFEEQRARWDRMDSRAQLGLREGTFAVLFSGKLITRKAPLLLVEAMRKLECANAALIVVGDGPLREPVCSAARNVLGDRFLYQGFVNQTRMGLFYAAADVLVLPSTYEPWGLVVNEAMQFGLPVVTSDGVACRRDLVTDRETGFVFRRGDACGLAARLNSLLSNPDLRERMGRNARLRVSSYSTEASCGGILAALGLSPTRDTQAVQ